MKTCEHVKCSLMNDDEECGECHRTGCHNYTDCEFFEEVKL